MYGVLKLSDHYQHQFLLYQRIARVTREGFHQKLML